jgi:hypothetical protein
MALHRIVLRHNYILTSCRYMYVPYVWLEWQEVETRTPLTRTFRRCAISVYSMS